ncbi:MAG: hypothetical protein ACYC6B_09195 [Thermoleophilia bacterium]
MTDSKYSSSVFVNCPFDDAYREIFNAIIFSIFDCGYIPRCALEFDDGSQVRIDKIIGIIEECKFGIHDISRTELDGRSKLPRFNMPFELGLFMGAKKYGIKLNRKKISLILDREQYRYQTFLSDIAGQDIRAHEDNPEKVIPIIRNWLQNSSGRVTIPGGREILRRFHLFTTDLPGLCTVVKLDQADLIFNDYATMVSGWLRQNP